MNDTQVKDHIYHIVEATGAIGEYKDFIKAPLSKEVIDEINELVAYIKLNY